ncbi:TetR/AcrR family transcriptional regulator [Paenibacillus soyae]|uniref:TetR/AcrR family transcriptional regulator n=1 Tax=Paenibacillus soyae TaxID=2969249 RepID=A0A9X2MW94_9BACL|nr:TetR/AcrR family transcriptional regulator [Paenibacillus soyae]MCR2807048.1 TetR/AcrR family transcriptional regulator [Paenibacillus soyae]
MPRTPEENERIRKSAKENIRAAAMEVFMEKGYHGAAIDDIAKRAGVSKGLMYNYYKGKEELLAAMVNKRIDEIKEVMQSAAALGSSEEQLAYIINGALANVEQRPREFRFYLHMQTQPEEDKVLSEYSQVLNKAMAQQFEAQCGMFAGLGESEARARSLYFSSSLQGAMLMIATLPGHYSVEKLKQQLIEQFCQ